MELRILQRKICDGPEIKIILIHTHLFMNQMYISSYQAPTILFCQRITSNSKMREQKKIWFEELDFSGYMAFVADLVCIPGTLSTLMGHFG